jgi:DNA-binding response OmpR family regulator
MLKKILVVDDEDVTRLTLLRILQLEGYEVVGVENGVAALEELNRCPYDGMIVDIKMPGMNGMELVEKVIEQIPRIPIVVLTAYGSFETAVQALRMQVVDYLVKPASAETILTSIKRALQSNNTSGEQKSVGEVNDSPYDVTHQKDTLNLETTVIRLSNGVMIDCGRRRISWNEEAIHLTPAETKLIAILLANNTLVLKHQELVEKIYGYKVGGEESARILRPIVCRLNKKLEQTPGGDNWIKNVRGKGYLLEII